MTTPGIHVDPTSLDNAATALRDLSVDLQSGQVDLFLLDWAAPPRNHPDVAQATRRFAEFANDQYQDAVALLAALSTKVEAAGDVYAQANQANVQQIDEYLGRSTFQPADQRPA